MTIQIVINLPESPDIIDKIGTISHQAAIAGGSATVHQFVQVPKNITPPEATATLGDVSSVPESAWPDPPPDEVDNPAQGTRGAQARRRRS